MRTEDDLRAALTTLEREAPDPQAVLAQLTEPGRRRATRPRILLATAAATALAAAAVPTLRALTTGPDDPAAGPGWPGPGDQPSQRWQWAFSVATPDGWQPLDRAIGDLFLADMNSQVAEFQPGRNGNICSVTVYKPGAFDEDRIPAERTPIEVNGRPGYVAAVRPPVAPASSPVPATVPATVNGQTVTLQDILPRGSSEPEGPSIVWQYARDAWALSTCDQFGPRRADDVVVADERKLAEATSFGVSPLRVPFKINALPSGWSGYQITDEDRSRRGWPQPDVWLNLKPTDAQTGAPMDRNVSILYTRGTPAKPSAGSTRLQVAGLPAWISEDGSTITAMGHGFELRVQGAKDQLLQIAQGLELVANPLDESTWFDGTVAIP